MRHIRLYENFAHIDPALEEVYNAHPELAQVGTLEEYEAYTRTIFPQSRIKLPLYHSSQHAFEDFDEEKIASSTDAGALGRGFYFSQFPVYSKVYGPHTKICLVNLIRPKLLHNLDGYNKEYEAYSGKSVKEVFGEQYDGVALYMDDWVGMTKSGEHVSSLQELYAIGLGRQPGYMDVVVPHADQIHELGTPKDTQEFARYKREA
jgi:hypothetical protein